MGVARQGGTAGRVSIEVTRLLLRNGSSVPLKASTLDASGGFGLEAQVFSSKALAVGARVLIMDEPTSSLSQHETDQLYAVVKDLRKRGVGIVYISHRLEEIFALADRVTVLRDGESVGTQAMGNLTEAELIKRMVGREVSLLYPPAEGAPGEVALDVRGLGCTAAGVRSSMAAWRRACSVSFLASVIIRSTSGRTALALVMVVTMRSCSITLVIRLRSNALRLAVGRLSLNPATLCLISYSPI